MVKLESYSNLCKKQENLLSLGYIFNKLLSLKIISKTQDFDLITKAKKNSQVDAKQFVGSAALTYSHKDAKISFKTNSNRDIRGSAEVYPDTRIKDFNLKDLKIKAEIKANQLKATVQNSISLDYSNKYANTKLELWDGAMLKFSGVFGRNGIGLGVNTVYNIIEPKITAYNLAFFWFQKHSRFIVKHSTDTLKLGVVNLSYYQKISPELKIGVSLECPWGSLPKTEFGGSYQWHKDTEVKTKVNSQGKVAATIKQRLSKNFEVIMASELNTSKLTSDTVGDCKLGVHLNLE